MGYQPESGQVPKFPPDPDPNCTLAPHDMEWLKGDNSDLKRKICDMKNEISNVKQEIHDMKNEISDMKESIMGIGEYFKEEVGFILAEVIYLLHEPQDT